MIAHVKIDGAIVCAKINAKNDKPTKTYGFVIP